MIATRIGASRQDIDSVLQLQPGLGLRAAAGPVGVSHFQTILAAERRKQNLGSLGGNDGG